jgi:hypothetical protein
MKHKFSDLQFITAVAESFSIRHCLELLGLAQAGGSYDTFRKTAKRLDVDYSHFKGQGWSKGKKQTKIRKRVTTKSILLNEFPFQSNKLRLRLLEEGYFKPICSSCSLAAWMGKPIPLELEHISGNNKDNSLENLCLLCPNCHALTPTYRGRNIAKQQITI